MRQRILLTMVVLSAGMAGASAQTLAVKLNDGTEQDVSLSAIKKITFSGTNLLLNYTAGTTQMHGLTTINKILFNASSSSIETPLSTGVSDKVSIYQDPTRSVIYFQNLPDNTSQVIIYRANGVMVMNTQIEAGTPSINMSNLASGFYILRINNQVFKIIK